MKCPKCGAENPEAGNYCQSCGLNLAVTDAGTAAIPVKTSGLAIAALILGILSFFSCGLLIIPALICGIIALVKIGGSNGRLKGTGMAITGIVLPVVVLPVMALLMAVLMPALAQTRRLAQRIICAENLSGIGKAMIVYAEDNDGRFPEDDRWCDILMEQMDVPKKMFVCRSTLNQDTCSYSMNSAVEILGIKSPPDMVLVFESKPGWNQSGGIELVNIESHQGEGCNILFVDGSVKFVKPEEIPKLRWDTDENI